MPFKRFAVSAPGVYVFSIALTALAAFEAAVPFWAPFFIVYAVLAIAVPLSCRSHSFGNFFSVMQRSWPLLVSILALDIVWELGIWTWGYEWALEKAGMKAVPFYSLDAALGQMLRTAASRHGMSDTTTAAFLGFFVLLWAPLGEELFYRGYIFGALRKHRGLWCAAAVSSLFFSMRHALHFLYLWPEFPAGAAVAWAFSTFVPGLYVCYLYEKTGSLYPLIIEHIFVNILWIVTGT
jgi:membrane protease YdiL (CAAX protease family)